MEKGAEGSAFRGWPCRVWAGPVLSLPRWPSVEDTESVPVFLPGLHRLPLSVTQSGSFFRRSEHPPCRERAQALKSLTATGGHLLWDTFPQKSHWDGPHSFDIVIGVPQPCILSQGALEATLLTSRSGQPVEGQVMGDCRRGCGHGVPGHPGDSSVGGCSFIFCSPRPTECPKMLDTSMSHF